MTSEVRVTFWVDRPSAVPRVGHRKLIRVNGRPENLWCTNVEANLVRSWDEATGTKLESSYEGVATYGRLRTP